MKKLFMLVTMLGLMTSMTACGGDDDEVKVPDVPAPKFVSVTPADGTTNVTLGTVSVAVEFDQNVFFVTSNTSKISITGGTINSARANGKQLDIEAVCTEPGTLVTITIPEGLVLNTQRKAAATVKFSFTMRKSDTPTPVDDGHESAAQAVKNMGPGWNLGNTLDAWAIADWFNPKTTADYETVWGQPVTDAHLMKALKEKGFGAVRVPVTWMLHMDADGNVDDAWMNRVEEVVNYVLDAGMYCILNVHHDTGADAHAWIKADNSTFEATKPRYQKLWTQIATRFRDYGVKLLFEGYNEMLYGSDGVGTGAQWTQPQNTQNYQAINNYAKAFVEAVRATGGNNMTRNLIITTYSASHTQLTLSSLTIPTDPCGNQNHLAVEVHSYDPWDWVNQYNMTWTQACHNTLVEMFRDLQTYIISKGYPVIIGEYGTNGSGEKTINASSTTAQKAEAGKQAGDMTRLCRQNDAAAFYWMGLIDGADRSEATFKWTMEQVADSIVKAYRQ